jgi:hypothetical protein
LTAMPVKKIPGAYRFKKFWFLCRGFAAPEEDSLGRARRRLRFAPLRSAPLDVYSRKSIILSPYIPLHI